MSFLTCIPSVFVINNEYEILVNTIENGLISVIVGDSVYYPENSGVLYSQKNYAKIRVPQKKLNNIKEYTILYKKTIERKAYYSRFENEESQTFKFKPIEKQENINIYMIADVHYKFELALKTASYFGNTIDLLIVNGDIGEVETFENFVEVAKFVGDISRGEIPVVFVRGNHDVRGKFAELYTDFFPANGRDTFFIAKVGQLKIIVFDCGEDKLDSNPEYGANLFEPYRKKQLNFLKKIRPKKNELLFAVGHICPVQTTFDKGDCFDIEREIYTKWNKEFERLNILFMLCGHMHSAYVLRKGDKENIIDHTYPVIVGSACFIQDDEGEDFVGTAIVVKKEEVEISFTNRKHIANHAITIERRTN